MDVVFQYEKGEELKVFYHASAAAICDGNLPSIAMQYILATIPKTSSKGRNIKS
jgi:hypothetical protein